jgi:hypothetical protein
MANSIQRPSPHPLDTSLVGDERKWFVRTGEPIKPKGPTSVSFVKRELLNCGVVAWTFHKRRFDKLE